MQLRQNISPLNRTPSRTPEAGFTLVEMLTVLVIIGLMSSAAILTFPSQKTALDVQAQNFLRDVNSVSQDAILSGQNTAMGVSREGYVFYKFGSQGWTVLSEATWEDVGKPEFKLGEEPLELAEEAVPLIIFESIGISEPFTLTVSDMRSDYIFSSEGDSRITLDKKT